MRAAASDSTEHRLINNTMHLQGDVVNQFLAVVMIQGLAGNDWPENLPFVSAEIVVPVPVATRYRLVGVHNFGQGADIKTLYNGVQALWRPESPGKLRPVL